jgi:hypothetical protein
MTTKNELIRKFSSIPFLLAMLLLQINVNGQQYTADSTSGDLDAVSWEDGGETDIEFSDINNDGFMDMLCIGGHGSPGVNTNSHGVMVWFGDGTGTHWTLSQNGNFGYGGLAVGDVNNDGNKDIGYAMHHNYSSTDFGDQYQEVALGDGTGINWTAYDDSLGMNGESWGMNGTDFGDIDNDGDLDIGSIALGCCDGIHIHKNSGNGTWPESFGLLGGNSRSRIQFGDIDQDGNLDFVVTHEFGAAYFGDGTGNFVRNDSGIAIPLSFGFWEVDLADVDNDGTLELGTMVSGIIKIYKYSTITHIWQPMSAVIPSGSHYSVLLRDFDMDGFVDLQTFKSGTINLYKGDGGTSWTQVYSDSVVRLERAFEVNAADVDHNGRPDIIMLGRYPVSLVNDEVNLKLFREKTIATQLNISAVYPKGHEYFSHGSVRFIEWMSSVPTGMKGKVTLEFSDMGPTGPWYLIASGVPNNDKYQWTVPQNNSINCYIRYTLTDSISGQTDTAITPAPFTIGSINTVSINSPEKNYFNINIYPNPFSDKTVVTISTKDNFPSTAQLFDTEGRMVKEWKNVINTISIQRNGIGSGVYSLRISNSNGNNTVKKVVIQ